MPNLPAPATLPADSPPPGTGSRLAWLVPVVLLAALALAAGLARSPPPRDAPAPRGNVLRVADGDTLTVLHEGKRLEVRLSTVDAPERDQPHGKAARDRVRALTRDATVTVVPETVDRYGRTVARVLLPDGRSLAEVLLAEGHAWHFKRFSRDRALAALEAEAREARRGLWGKKDPTPPWRWREQGAAR